MLKLKIILTACGGNYNAAYGSFSSPNYPNSYGFNENCQYTIQVGSYDRVVLQFAYFYTEGNFDYVTVWPNIYCVDG
jgi:hypothetical protein